MLRLRASLLCFTTIRPISVGFQAAGSASFSTTSLATASHPGAVSRALSLVKGRGMSYARVSETGNCSRNSGMAVKESRGMPGKHEYVGVKSACWTFAGTDIDS